MKITLGMHDPREPERARKGPKGPDEASMINNRIVMEVLGPGGILGRV